MKLPSIKNILTTSETTTKRFPMAVLTGVVSFFIGIILLHADDPGFYPNILLTLVLGFPLFTSATLLSEQRGWHTSKVWIARAAIALFLVIYYTLLPEQVIYSEDKFLIRYALWLLSFILAVTFILFLHKEQPGTINAFWQYNRLLIFSFALTVFWAGAIQIGLSIALGSIDVLFDLDIDGERYAEIWIFLVSIFGPIFFLSRIPKSSEAFYKRSDYPHELQLFSQYVLTPLVSLYFLILYAYVVRILITQEWPEGVLAYMILGFSFIGVLTYTALYPLRETVSWVRKAGTGFFIVVIPQIGMLFWALWFRVAPYGITENRYFVGVFGIWLLLIALFYIFAKVKDIRLLPITFFVVTLIASFGPWGAFAVAEQSQVNRLEEILVRNELLIDGKIVKTETELPQDDTREISEITRYLVQTHGVQSIQPWFNEDLSTYTLPTNEYSKYNYRAAEEIVTDLIGIEYLEAWEGIGRNDEYFFANIDFEKQNEPVNVEGYQYYITVYNSQEPFTIDDSKFTLALENNSINIIKDNQVITTVQLEEKLKALMDLTRQAAFNRDDLTFIISNEYINAKLLLNNVNGTDDQKGFKVTSFNGILLITVK